MPLSPGTKLGPYEIRAPIGAGGDRFSREVRAVAALNHPNICHLYDVGPVYLVMELVEGTTLAKRIEQGAVPLDEALNIARQIADALEAAHEKGIVHRDLKPGNIILRPDGTAKVLDFGLARVTGATTSGERTPHSPTLTVEAATQAGAILGTAAYMSPEQARGKVVDKRADIWAFGVVLYEMLTGERLFEGETFSDTLIEVATKEPNWERVPAGTQRLLRRCLEKDPRRRLRDIGDAWFALGDAPPVEKVEAVPSRLWQGARLAWCVAGLLAVGLGPVAFLHFREKPPLRRRRCDFSLSFREPLILFGPFSRPMAANLFFPQGIG
jgi:serine/threonine-protein kinase